MARIEAALANGVAQFNIGSGRLRDTMAAMGLIVSQSSIERMRMTDARQITQAEKRSSQRVKDARKKRQQAQWTVLRQQQRDEGTTYGAGEF